MEDQHDSRAYYEILGVDKNASLDEIKSAYEEKSKECKEKIEKINAAYEVLSDSQKRQEYDAFLEQ
jgi:DnaJ-class molecular chaperone